MEEFLWLRKQETRPTFPLVSGQDLSVFHPAATNDHLSLADLFICLIF